jgi:hypothetical protein
VRVEQRGADGLWRQVAAVHTGADGIWSAAPTLLVNGPLRAVATLPDGRELTAPEVAAQVRARIAVRLSRRVMRPGGELEVSGTTAPAKGRVRVILERRIERGRFRRIRGEAVTTTDGAFAHILRLPSAGDYRIRVTTPADRTNAAGRSRAIGVRVRPARS